MAHNLDVYGRTMHLLDRHPAIQNRNMKKNSLIAFLVLVFITSGIGQTNPFQIALDPMTIPDLGGVQAFAFGRHQEKFLVIGGRLDGLHRRQPWASFDEAGHNNQLMVVDPEAQQVWTAPLTSLPIGIQEQLSATNMEFLQDDDYLYIIGGYGYSPSEDDHITYPNLTAVNVSNVVEAIINETDFETYFRQITDEKFAVTGGYLNKIYNTFKV